MIFSDLQPLLISLHIAEALMKNLPRLRTFTGNPASAPGDAEQWALDPASDVGSERPSELRTFLEDERLWNLFISKNPSKITKTKEFPNAILLMYNMFTIAAIHKESPGFWAIVKLHHFLFVNKTPCARTWSFAARRLVAAFRATCCTWPFLLASHLGGNKDG